MNKRARIYIAGHAGLLGSSLYNKLQAGGFDNLLVRPHKELDLTQQTAVFDFFKKEKPEYVFLCAGVTGGIIANKTRPADFLHVNLSIQNNVFEAALKYEANKIVFYGSSCMYPKNSLQPIKEEYLLSGEIESTSEAYAIAKICGIIACRSYNSQYGNRRFIALVPNTMYGPNDDFNLEHSHFLSALIKKIHQAKTENSDVVQLWGSGKARRELVFVDDVAEASLYAIDNSEKMENCHYNVGTGRDYSIKEIAKMIADLVGFKGSIVWDKNKPEGTLKKLLDSSAFSRLGWKPTVPLENGLKKTYDWFLNKVVCCV